MAAPDLLQSSIDSFLEREDLDSDSVIGDFETPCFKTSRTFFTTERLQHALRRHKKGEPNKWDFEPLCFGDSFSKVSDVLFMLRLALQKGKISKGKWSKKLKRRIIIISWHFTFPLGFHQGHPLHSLSVWLEKEAGAIQTFFPNDCHGTNGCPFKLHFKSVPPPECLDNHLQLTKHKKNICKKCGKSLRSF